MELEPILHDLEQLPGMVWKHQIWYIPDDINFREKITGTYQDYMVHFSRVDELYLLQARESGISLSLVKENTTVFSVYKPFPHNATTEEEKRVAERLEESFSQISKKIPPENRILPYR